MRVAKIGWFVVALALCGPVPQSFAQGPVSASSARDGEAGLWRPRYPSSPLPQIGKGMFQVTIVSDSRKLKKHRLETAVIMIRRSDKTPVDDAKVTVRGEARDVVRQMSTVPRVTKNLGHGKYQISGLRFSMDGSWLLQLNITSGAQKDKALVELEIK